MPSAPFSYRIGPIVLKGLRVPGGNASITPIPEATRDTGVLSLR